MAVNVGECQEVACQLGRDETPIWGKYAEWILLTVPVGGCVQGGKSLVSNYTLLNGVGARQQQSGPLELKLQWS